MRKNVISYLMEYANKKHLLPLTGAELYKLQDEAFKLPDDYDETLNLTLKQKFNITLANWKYITKYMGNHYFPILSSEHVPINRFIQRYAKERGGYMKAEILNYFYSLLNNAYKAGYVNRKKNLDGVFIYHYK